MTSSAAEGEAPSQAGRPESPPLDSRHADEYRTVAQGVARLGWPAGFEQALPGLTARRVRSLHRELWLRHTGWKGVFDPCARGMALVVDCGYGSAAISLAGDFTRVFAIVPDEHRRRIVEARAQSMGVSNLEVLPGLDAGAIPDLTFDAVAIHGFSARATARVLRRPLAGIRLSAAATVFVGIDGGGGPLERAAAVSIRRQLDRRFAVVERFDYDDDLTGSSELIPSDSVSFRRQAALLAPWRRRAFAMVASVSSSPQSLFVRVRSRVEAYGAELWGDRTALTCRRRMFSTPEGFALLLVGGRAGSLIVRISLNGRTSARFQRNFNALTRLNRGLRRLDTPTPLLAEDIAGTPFFVETTVEGEALRSCLDPRWEDVALGAAIEWIGDLHRATSIPRVLSEAEMTALVTEPVAAAFRFIGRPEDDPGCAALRRYLVASLTGHRLPLVFAHGDYSVDNVLVGPSRARVSGVFDWDLSSDRSLPLIDVYYLLISAALASKGGSFGQRVADALEGRLWNAPMEEAIRQYCLALGIPESLRQPLLALTWVFHLAYRIQNPEPYRWPSVDTDLASPALGAILNRIAPAGAGEHLRDIA